MERTGKRTIILITTLLAVGLVVGFAVKSCAGKRSGNPAVDTESGRVAISVSIPPLKYLVDRITGGEVTVNVILPPGSSPETYEPTPRSLKALEDSRVIFITGLIDFENVIAHRSGHANTVTLLTDNMDLIEGDHNHNHNHNHDHSHGQTAHNSNHNRGKDHSHRHAHGIDPHIWVSPAYLKEMAGIILATLSPDGDDRKYRDNYISLVDDLDATDEYIHGEIAASGVSSFLIYHPALTYYARDYGLEQLQLEYDGKEPSADKLRSTMARAQAEGLDKILYQKEFSVKAVETVAKNLGAVPVEIDPLDGDILGNLRIITDIITGREGAR